MTGVAPLPDLDLPDPMTIGMIFLFFYVTYPIWLRLWDCLRAWWDGK